MKKILTPLAGIVFLISILVAGSCGNSKKQNDSTQGKDAPAAVIANSKKEIIYLKDTIIDGRMHLLMNNEKHPKRKVINDLVTNVDPGDTVFWKKAQKSNIDEILRIEIVTVCETSLPNPIREDNKHSLVIPLNTKPGIAKYDIVFTVKKDKTTYTIDPYLKIR